MLFLNYGWHFIEKPFDNNDVLARVRAQHAEGPAAGAGRHHRRHCARDDAVLAQDRRGELRRADEIVHRQRQPRRQGAEGERRIPGPEVAADEVPRHPGAFPQAESVAVRLELEQARASARRRRAWVWR